MQRKNIPIAWVQEKMSLLQQRLPTDIQASPFYPDAFFYAQYYRDKDKGLRVMAALLFGWLHIEPKQCVVDFYDEKKLEKRVGADVAGFYTRIVEEGKQQEVILINQKHRDDPFAVGAILAHEMMHLYLFRLGLQLDDTQENELLTDLATIRTGLALCILNGMTHSSHWRLTLLLLLIGRIYWRTEQQAFGYFKLHEYGKHALSYFAEKNISPSVLAGYLQPKARKFIGASAFSKSEKPTEFIAIIEQQYRTSTFRKTVLTFIAIAVFVTWGIVLDYKKTNLRERITQCKAELTTLKSRLDKEVAQAKKIEKDFFLSLEKEDLEKSLELVKSYEGERIEKEVDGYNMKVDACNTLVEEYKKKY